MSEENLSKRHNDPLLQRIHDDLQEMKALQEHQKATLDEMKEILVIWNNTKGFINTVRMIGTVLKWVVGAGTAAGLLIYWIKH
jgi:hypothetical protein